MLFHGIKNLCLAICQYRPCLMYTYIFVLYFVFTLRGIVYFLLVFFNYALESEMYDISIYLSLKYTIIRIYKPRYFLG